ncbi:MAG TPA: SAM-dependent chlorinase/fluorinase [Thermoanaerobaculia bacterium]|nr:SAM-dependent chlorinase/fluorinase [Thermoanaerobaculia bacterium]
MLCLLTDFGTRDPYVAAMRGVIAGRTAEPVIDLSHEIAPFDVLEGAWFLRSVVPYWPEGTIFVAVIDPGVGSERRIVAAHDGGKLFLAPDNGLLSLVLGAGAALRSVENQALFLPHESTTFHGRDRFAPVAAALANGLPFPEVGPPLEAIVRLPYEPPNYGEDHARGTVVAIDRFGNLITDIEHSRLGFAPFELRARDLTIERLERNYAGAEPGPFLVIGSSGCLEISVANGSAAERLGIRRLQRVEVARRPV